MNKLITMLVWIAFLVRRIAAPKDPTQIALVPSIWARTLVIEIKQGSPVYQMVVALGGACGTVDALATYVVMVCSPVLANVRLAKYVLAHEAKHVDHMPAGQRELVLRTIGWRVLTKLLTATAFGYDTMDYMERIIPGTTEATAKVADGEVTENVQLIAANEHEADAAAAKRVGWASVACGIAMLTTGEKAISPTNETAILAHGVPGEIVMSRYNTAVKNAAK